MTDTKRMHSHRHLRPLLIATSALGLAVVVGAAPAEAAQCGTVSTANGGQARFINTYRTPCKTAVTVARRARGRSYVSGGFRCKATTTPGISGKSYDCQGAGRSLGFIYRPPS